MMPGRLTALACTCFLASLTVATAVVAVPQLLRIAFGVLIVFILPGFAVVCAVLPARQFSFGEHLLASLGISLMMATCAAVILGATPIGLSHGSFAACLGGSTMAVSIYARFRIRYDTRVSRDSAPEGIGR
jgi:uncharacterized membrane protein